MGSLVFTRADDNRTVSFDSSPQYTLPKMFGWWPDTLRLTETSRNAREIVFDVHGATTEQGAVRKVGVLRQKTREQIWKEQAGTSSR